MVKLIVIIGVTGNQGRSVADTFLQKNGWKVRGTTRDVTQAVAKSLEAKGVEIVRADVNDVESVKAAVQGAHTVFGNTVFPNDFQVPSPEALAKLRPNQTLREWCYELEYSQGKNIADAVASADGLQLFIWSSLSAAKKWSNGTYTGVYHFDSKADVVEYIKQRLPALHSKMSILQMGLFVTNWKWGRIAVPWEKLADGSFLLRIPGTGDVPVPFLIPSDAGHFVWAVAQAGPGKNVLAYNGRLTWNEYVKLWSKIVGVPATFAKTTVSVHANLAPEGFGDEMAQMYAYAQDFGYDGSDPSVIHADSLGIQLPVRTIEEYIKTEDWSELLGRPITATE